MNNRNNLLKDILWFFVFFALIAGIFRMVFGLGATTNLTDQVPWGLWKVFNMIAGVALSTCGFTLGFLVYVLKIEKFRPLVKPAILIAFLGYGASSAALLFDIGLPHRFWHPFVFWNEHSFLFEVFWCVILYFTITFIETAPNILERFNAEKTVKFLHRIAIGVVIVGISLSSLHHSSLGSLFLVSAERLHALWYSPMIPLHFIISAMGVGMMFLILARITYAKLYDPEPIFGPKPDSPILCTIDGSQPKRSVFGKDMTILSTLSIISASILGLYLILKIYSLFADGSIEALMAGTWQSWLYIIEIVTTAIIPIILVAIKRTRRTPTGLTVASISASFGLVLNRLNVGIFAYFKGPETVYFPSLAEWALSIGVVAGAGLVFFYISEYFSIFNENWKTNKTLFEKFQPSFDSISRVWNTALQSSFHRVSLLGIFALPIAFALMYPAYDETQNTVIQPAMGANQERTELIIDGNRNGVETVFKHKMHEEQLGNEESCIKCHHMSMPGDKSTPCSRCHQNMIGKTNIFDHDYHTLAVARTLNIAGIHPENHTCYECHPKGQAKTTQNAIACINCHNEDMHMTRQAVDTLKVFKFADSYVDIMHNNCQKCHFEMAEQVGRKTLGDCSTCHATFKPNSWNNINFAKSK